MVDIYLNIKGRQVLALSIPVSDIERLSLRPVKWLRFLTFAVCGVRGDLSVVPGGPPVDYDSISLAGLIAEAYYYTPKGDYHIIDYKGLNDRMTSSDQTPHSSDFHHNVMERDGPYIRVILQDRLNSYNPALEPSILEINSVENGMFLRKDLHGMFGDGFSAFLKTPNFALDPSDIPRVEVGLVPPQRTTLQHLVPDINHIPILQSDARVTGTGIAPPSTIILDFLYGVAAYQCWGSKLDSEIKTVMQDRFTELYESIPVLSSSQASSDVDHSPEPEDPDGSGKYLPRPQRGQRHSSNMPDSMLNAMDNILTLSMLVKGRTPESMAAERQRQEEAAELHAKEASEVKVQQWMQNSPDFQSNAAASQTTTDTVVDMEHEHH